MNKKAKISIIAVSVIVVVATILGVLYWGLQPIQEEKVSLEKLNKKLGARYCMPSKLPFEGDVECNIIYVRANMGVVLTRFEISPRRSTGYSIKLKDSNRDIYVEVGNSMVISAEAAERLLKENYNDQQIEYRFSETETDSDLMILFEINGKTYYISAKYSKDESREILKSDIECILNQMIK